MFLVVYVVFELLVRRWFMVVLPAHVGWGFCMGRVVGAVLVFASEVLVVLPGAMVWALACKAY